MRQVRRSLVDVVASRRRLEHGVAQLQELAARELQRAEQAIAQGLEEEARFFLTERQDALAQAEELRTSIEKLVLDEQQLHRAQNRLKSRMRVRQAREDSSNARLLAARTAVSVNEALAGLSEEERGLAEAAELRDREARQLRGRGRALGDLLDEARIRDPYDRSSERDARLSHDLRRLGAEIELDDLRQRVRTPPGTRPEANQIEDHEAAVAAREEQQR